MGILYSSLKFLQFPEHLRAIRERRVVAPVHVRVKPINHCNHGCWYCAYRADQLQLGEDMDVKDRLPEAKMREIVADIVAMGVKAVTFSGGGEPLLYKSLPEHIERLARGGVRVAALTNGSNLQGRMADAFAAHGTWIRVSLDAWDDASYAASRGIPEGSFSRVIANLTGFARRGSPCVLGVSFIISQRNHAHIAEVCARLKGIGVNHVKLAAAVVSNDVGENNRYHRTIVEAVGAEIARAKALADSSFTVLDHYHETEARFDKGYSFCPSLQYLTVIGADGTVYTCQDKAYAASGILGSIKDRSFKEFWFSEENRARLYALDPSRHCRHHCVAHAKNLAILETLSLDPEHAVFV